MAASADAVSRNLNENNVTQAVIERFANTPDPRLKVIVNALVRHLHDFAREVKLTEDEWYEGIKFLTATGHKCTDTRQEFILLSDTIGLSQLVCAQSNKRDKEATEQTVFGPFHIENAPKLANGADISGKRKGDPCYVNALIKSVDGKPIANAQVDVWQADAEGFYDVQDPNWSIDHTELRATFSSDAKGVVAFKTIKPCAYPIPTDGPVGVMLNATKRHPMRPAHIHFMVHAPGYEKLITHIFVEGDEYLDSDAVFGVRSSCIGNYVRHGSGAAAPDGKKSSVPFFTLDYTFGMQPA
ncbi:MAG: intradiol ring-cleavage dioxygenase [Burkholderiales bacterium]